MKINIYLSLLILNLIGQLYCQTLNTESINIDKNPINCFAPWRNHSNIDDNPKCNCEWEKLYNINLSNYLCTGKTGVKVLEDNFNGTTLDFNIWKLGFPWGTEVEETAFATSGMPYGNNVYVDNGFLYLVPKKEHISQGQFGLTWDGMPSPPKELEYTQPSICSLMNFGYGAYEIRCKMPDNPENLNSAFWLYGHCSNEIDVFETFDDTNVGGIFDNNPNQSHTNMRIKTTAFSSNGHCNDGNRCLREYHTKIPYGQTLNQWHTYRLLWNEFSIQLTIDGIPSYEFITSMFKTFPTPSAQLCGELNDGNNYRKMISYPYETNTRMRVLAGVGIRDHETTKKNDPPLLPNLLGNDRIMIVDYIKVWQSESCGQIQNLCGIFPGNPDNGLGSNPEIVFGSIVNISSSNCGWQLLGGTKDQSVFTAIGENEVSLLPGFIAEANSIFSAYIQPCVYNEREGRHLVDTIIINNDLKSEDILKVTPNPNNGVFDISLLVPSKAVLKIYNNIGKLIYEEILDESINKKNVNLSHIPNGFYYLNYQTNEKSYSTKFVINE